MIEPPETGHHAEHRKSSVRWFDVTMAVGVLLVSAGSLYVALHTGHTMEKLVEQNERLVHAQSTPVLRFGHGNVNDEGQPSLDFEVSNVGSGVARILTMSIRHQGRTFATVADFNQSLDVGGGETLFTTTSEIARTTLPPGETVSAFKWPRPDTPAALAQWRRLDEARFEATATVCYCSVFEECWVSNMKADIPREVESCERPVPVPSGAERH